MLSFEAVTTWGQALELRGLRNQCAGWMTGSTTFLSVPEQRKFFEEQILHGHVRAWLLRQDHHAAAYALLRPAEGQDVWMSCGVAENQRGRRLGTATVGLVTLLGHHLYAGAIRLLVWQDNEPARRIYLKTGYEITRELRKNGRVAEEMAHR